MWICEGGMMFLCLIMRFFMNHNSLTSHVSIRGNAANVNSVMTTSITSLLMYKLCVYISTSPRNSTQETCYLFSPSTWLDRDKFKVMFAYKISETLNLWRWLLKSLLTPVCFPCIFIWKARCYTSDLPLKQILHRPDLTWPFQARKFPPECFVGSIIPVLPAIISFGTGSTWHVAFFSFEQIYLSLQETKGA